MADHFQDVRERGSVDQLFRNTQQHLVALSAQADLKANIIITASALLLTIGVTKLQDSGLRVSVAILSVGCLVALLLAILAVLPMSSGTPEPTQRNPLFFVDAAAMSADEFASRVADACRNDGDVYRMQADDIHALSVYLARSKYRRLRLAYIAFLVGVVAATLHQLFQAFR